MNSISWCRAIMLVLLFIVIIGQGPVSAADATLAPGQVSTDAPAPGETESPDPKITIAPIHTKEPEVKPPVDQSTVTPVQTGVTPVRTVTVKPTTLVTPEETSSLGNNESAETYYQWGRAYADAGKCEAAIEEFDRAIARNPYYADAWYHRALCLETLGRWDEAYESYRFLLSVNPDYNPTGNGNLSSVRENISPPSIPPGGPSTLLIWILAGAGLAALVISGILIWYYLVRLGRVGSGNQVPVIPPVRRSYPKIDEVIASVGPLYGGDPVILREVLSIAIEIAREGREGKKVGTAFILGDTDEVLERSRQLILNPVHGHSDAERMITNPDMRENIKELSLVDGAFVIRGDGVVVAAGRYISIDTGSVDLPKGFGTRHVSVAAITGETKAAGIVVSESGGVVRIFLDGRMVAETG